MLKYGQLPIFSTCLDDRYTGHNTGILERVINYFDHTAMSHSFQRYQRFLFDISIILVPIIDHGADKQLRRRLYEVTHSPAWTEFEKGAIEWSACHHELEKCLEKVSTEKLKDLTEILEK